MIGIFSFYIFFSNSPQKFPPTQSSTFCDPNNEPKGPLPSQDAAGLPCDFF